MAETKREKDYIELLKFNFEHLHSSIWDAHKTSWTLTGIFFPLFFAGISFLVKEIKADETLLVIISGSLLLLLVTFWYGIQKLLASYNATRLEQLKKIESSFSDIFKEEIEMSGIGFRQYTLNYEDRGVYRKFVNITAFLCFFGVFLTMIVKLLFH